MRHHLVLQEPVGCKLVVVLNDHHLVDDLPQEQAFLQAAAASISPPAAPARNMPYSSGTPPSRGFAVPMICARSRFSSAASLRATTRASTSGGAAHGASQYRTGAGAIL